MIRDLTMDCIQSTQQVGRVCLFLYTMVVFGQEPTVSQY